MRALLCALALCVLIYPGKWASGQNYKSGRHLADWQVAKMSPEAFVERYTNGRSSYPGAGGLYREAIGEYDDCLHRYTARRARKLPTVARRRFREVSDLIETWDALYYECGMKLQDGTFWFDSFGGDKLRMEQILVAAESALRSRKSNRRLRTPSWEKELDQILVDMKKRKVSEVEYSDERGKFLKARKELILVTAQLRRALRKLPSTLDLSILSYLKNIHENMNGQSFPSPS